MTGNNRDFSILTLNVNGLNDPIKRHRTANWVKKTKPNHMWQETHVTEKKKIYIYILA
jgi:exonuclease III